MLLLTSKTKWLSTKIPFAIWFTRCHKQLLLPLGHHRARIMASGKQAYSLYMKPVDEQSVTNQQKWCTNNKPSDHPSYCTVCTKLLTKAEFNSLAHTVCAKTHGNSTRQNCPTFTSRVCVRMRANEVQFISCWHKCLVTPQQSVHYVFIPTDFWPLIFWEWRVVHSSTWH